MGYSFQLPFKFSFSAAIEPQTKELKAEESGILSEIEAQEALLKKLNNNFKK